MFEQSNVHVCHIFQNSLLEASVISGAVNMVSSSHR